MTRFYEASYIVPVLETERLRLREFRLEDFSHFVAFSNDPVVMRYFGGPPPTGEELWGKFLRNPAQWLFFDFGNWVIEDRVSGDFLGTTGLAIYKRVFETAALLDLPEISYMLVAKAHGKGYATEAVSAVLAWHDNKFGARQTKCLVNAENKPSLRVAAKAGYREHMRVRYKDENSILFTRAGKSGADGGN